VPIAIAIRAAEARGKYHPDIAEDFSPRTFLAIIPDQPPNFNNGALLEKVIDVPMQFGGASRVEMPPDTSAQPARTEGASQIDVITR
jgi:hypothetical protein